MTVDYRRCCRTRWIGNLQCFWFVCYSFVMNKIKWKRNVILSFVSVSNGYQFHFNFFLSNCYIWYSFIQTRKWFWIECIYYDQRSKVPWIGSIPFLLSTVRKFNLCKSHFSHDTRSKWKKKMFSALLIESHMSFQTFCHVLCDAYLEEIVSSP